MFENREPLYSMPITWQAYDFAKGKVADHNCQGLGELATYGESLSYSYWGDYWYSMARVNPAYGSLTP